MEFHSKEWIGAWDNFERYLDSTEPAMEQAWREAEEIGKVAPMFARGVKAFWRMACTTVTAENSVKIDGWNINGWENGLAIEWLDVCGGSLGKYHYTIERILSKGLEGKPNFLFHAQDADGSCPFAWLLAMNPMPCRSARLEGDYLSHLHFQFASSLDRLITAEETLVNPRWYATMCAAEGTLLDRCNVILGLHRLPRWTALPKNESK